MPAPLRGRPWVLLAVLVVVLVSLRATVELALTSESSAAVWLGEDEHADSARGPRPDSSATPPTPTHTPSTHPPPPQEPISAPQPVASGSAGDCAAFMRRARVTRVLGLSAELERTKFFVDVAGEGPAVAKLSPGGEDSFLAARDKHNHFGLEEARATVAVAALREPHAAGRWAAACPHFVPLRRVWVACPAPPPAWTASVAERKRAVSCWWADRGADCDRGTRVRPDLILLVLGVVPRSWQDEAYRTAGAPALAALTRVLLFQLLVATHAAERAVWMANGDCKLSHILYRPAGGPDTAWRYDLGRNATFWVLPGSADAAAASLELIDFHTIGHAWSGLHPGDAWELPGDGDAAAEAARAKAAAATNRAMVARLCSRMASTVRGLPQTQAAGATPGAAGRPGDADGAAGWEELAAAVDELAALAAAPGVSSVAELLVRAPLFEPFRRSGAAGAGGVVGGGADHVDGGRPETLLFGYEDEAELVGIVRRATDANTLLFS